MMNKRYFIEFLVVFVCLCIGNKAFSKDITFYRIEKAPPFLTGIMLKDRDIFAVFANATADSTATNTFSKLLKLNAGRKNCTSMRNVEVGVVEDSTPCVTLSKSADGSYVLNVVIRYKFPGFDMKNAGEVDVLKGYDYVRERRFVMTFSFDKTSCSANITQRSYVAIDGKKQVPARTGELACSPKR